MEGDYGGDWGFHHSHGLTHELLCASNVGQPWPNISFDPFRGFGTSPGPGLGLERSHNMGFDRAASSQDRNTHYSNRGTLGFRSSTSVPTSSYNEISVEQPPVYDIEVEDKNGDDEEEGIKWKRFWHRQDSWTIAKDKPLQEVNAKYKAQVNQYVHGDVSIAKLGGQVLKEGGFDASRIITKGIIFSL
uniref:Uncharacterized protein n=1 Tax=Fagus sylvatica TaxID=28930 RepID=A0A2N9EXS8_FAGSY